MSTRRKLTWCERLLWLGAAVALGIYGYDRLTSAISQYYESWSFVQTLNGQPASPKKFAGFLLGTEPLPVPSPPEPNNPFLDSSAGPSWPARLEIPRIGLSVMVHEGTDRRTLARGVGHIAGTSLPGTTGNIGLAGHRDTYFRRLGELKIGDSIRLTTLRGDYLYEVGTIRIVPPTATDVLHDTGQSSLTLVTCYPLWGLGPAPKRFIVQAAAPNSSVPD